MKSPIKRKTNNPKNGDYSMAHVLYQKLGSDWYAFTEVDGDCFMSKVSEEESNVTQMKSDDQTEDRQSRTKRRAA